MAKVSPVGNLCCSQCAVRSACAPPPYPPDLLMCVRWTMKNNKRQTTVSSMCSPSARRCRDGETLCSDPARSLSLRVHRRWHTGGPPRLPSLLRCPPELWPPPAVPQSDPTATHGVRGGSAGGMRRDAMAATGLRRFQSFYQRGRETARSAAWAPPSFPPSPHSSPRRRRELGEGRRAGCASPGAVLPIGAQGANGLGHSSQRICWNSVESSVQF